MRVAFLLFIVAILFPVAVNADVFINEIAWMGTANSTSDEWMELRNDGSEDVSLEGWKIEWRDGIYGAIISSANTDENKKCSNAVIKAGGYFLLERSDDNTVSEITADCFYTGALRNNPDGELVVLKNSAGEAVDQVNGLGGWPAGNNTTKETMQRSGSGWTTAAPTPKAINSGSTASPPPAPDPESPPPPPPPLPPPPSPTPPPPPPPPIPTTMPPPEPAAESGSSSDSSSAPTPSPTTSPNPSPAPAPMPESEPTSTVNVSNQTETSSLIIDSAPQTTEEQNLNVIENNQEPFPNSSTKSSKTLLENDHGSLTPVDSVTPIDSVNDQVALLEESFPESQKSIFSSSWFWFSVATALGILSAGGIFVLRKFL